VYETNNNAIVDEIKNEYLKIDKRWLRLQYLTFIGLVVFGFFVECILGLALYKQGYITIAFSMYFMKYMLTPLTFNFVFVLIGVCVMHAQRLKQKVKIYAVSILFINVCFIFASVHSVFQSMYLIFTVPILMTVVYSDYALTTVTALSSISARMVSDLFVTWDPDKAMPMDSTYGMTNFIISICIMLAFYVVCIVLTKFEKAKNAASIEKEIERYRIEQKLITDELTQVLNRTALRKELQMVEEDVSGAEYLFAMFDLDNFKMLNDRYGHDMGDQYLMELGKILDKNCDGDLPFRYGGDEFCVLFKKKTLDEVVRACTTIQKDLRESELTVTAIPFTVSIGIAQFSKQRGAAGLIRDTDMALYRSKKLKDTITVYEQMLEPAEFRAH